MRTGCVPIVKGHILRARMVPEVSTVQLTAAGYTASVVGSEAVEQDAQSLWMGVVGHGAALNCSGCLGSWHADL